MKKKIFFWLDKIVICLSGINDRLRNFGDNLTCKLSSASQRSYIIAKLHVRLVRVILIVVTWEIIIHGNDCDSSFFVVIFQKFWTPLN